MRNLGLLKVLEVFETLVEEAIELDREYVEAGIEVNEPAIVRYVGNITPAYSKMKGRRENDYYSLHKVVSANLMYLRQERESWEKYKERREEDGGS